MKKLMIGLFAMTMAVAAQAATCTWVLTNVYGPNGTDLLAAGSGTAYLFTTEVMSVADAYALAGTGADAIATAMNSGYQIGQTGAGKFSDTATKPDASTLGLTGGKSYSFYAVVFDTTSITDESNFYVTTTTANPVAIPTSSANAQIGLGSQAGTSKSQADGAWMAVNVPEPTSGLLLLLGMAGLELKRKQA